MNSLNQANGMSDNWAQGYHSQQTAGTNLCYPSETLVRLFKGDYLTGDIQDMAGKSVLDVGFGIANNTLLFASLGMKVSGVEIHQDICDEAKQLFERVGHDADFRVGSNQKLPYDDDQFDFLVSWNVLHYEGEEEAVSRGLKEYCRVLKPGGRLILSSTGPKHKILLNSRSLGDHRYEIGRPGDFRQGQVHYFFDDEINICRFFEAVFQNVTVGRIQDHLFRETLDWWLVTALKS